MNKLEAAVPSTFLTAENIKFVLVLRCVRKKRRTGENPYVQNSNRECVSIVVSEFDFVRLSHIPGISFGQVKEVEIVDISKIRWAKVYEVGMFVGCFLYIQLHTYV